jgi:CRP-like cAMP-binding protein
MSLDIVIKNLQAISNLPDTEWKFFKSLYQIRQYERGEYFLLAGNFSLDFGFVDKGLVRYFYTTFEGEEFNQTFKVENELVMSFTSILVGEPSNFSIQALEETSIHVTDYRNIQELYKRHPAWQELGRKIAEDNFIVKTKREEQLLLYSAQDRYKNFCKNFPHLLDRLSQVHIASFLGISPETLTRVIKKARED